MNVGQFGKTVSDAVTGLADSFTVPGPAPGKRAFVVSSDVGFHLDRAAVAAPATSMHVPVGQWVRISCVGGETLSYIVAAGEPDGTIWITEVE